MVVVEKRGGCWRAVLRKIFCWSGAVQIMLRNPGLNKLRAVSVTKINNEYNLIKTPLYFFKSKRRTLCHNLKTASNGKGKNTDT